MEYFSKEEQSEMVYDLLDFDRLLYQETYRESLAYWEKQD
jgi:hypothetical protein